MPQAVLGAAIVAGSAAAAGTTILGLSVAASAAVLAGATLGLRLLQRLVNNRPDIETEVRNQARPGAAMRVVYGRMKVGMNVADIRDDPNNDIDLHTVRAFTVASEDGGDIAGVRKVWFDEEIALDAVDKGWNGTDFTGGLTDNYLPEQQLGASVLGVVDDPWVGGNLGELSHRFDYELKLGGVAQTGSTGSSRLGGLNDVFPEAWPTTSQGDGLAWFNFLLRQEPNPENRGVFRGVPNFTAEVDGRRVYDPRDGTWKFSRNPALIILDYLTSEMVGFGFNYPERDGTVESPTQVDEASFIAAANHCDEQVAVPDDSGGTTTQARYTCDIALNTEQSLKRNLALLESSCNGHVIWQEGKARLWIRQAQAPVDVTLDEDNIVGDWQFKLLGSGDVANSLTVQFPEAGRDYTTQEITWPDPDDTNPYLDADNGVRENTNLKLHATTDAHRAERIAATLLKEERADLRVALTANEEALQLQVGDLVPITHDLPGANGWTEKLFWVESMTIGQEFQVQLALREYDADAYTREGQTDRESVPDDSLPTDICTGNEEPDWDTVLEAFWPMDELTNRGDGEFGCDANESRPYGAYRFSAEGNAHVGFVEKQTGASSYMIWDTENGSNCTKNLSWDDGRCTPGFGIPDAHDGSSQMAVTTGGFMESITNASGSGGFSLTASFKFNAAQSRHALFGQSELGAGWYVVAKNLGDSSGAKIEIGYSGNSQTLNVDPIDDVADSIEDSPAAGNSALISDAEWYDIGVTFHEYITELGFAPVTVVMNGTLQGAVFIDEISPASASTNLAIGGSQGGSFGDTILGAYDQPYIFNEALSVCQLRYVQTNLCTSGTDGADKRSGDQITGLKLEQTALDTCSGGGGLDLKLTPTLTNLPDSGEALITWYEDGTVVNTETEVDLFNGDTERTYSFNKSGVGSDATSTSTHTWRVEMVIKDEDGSAVDSKVAFLQPDDYGTC